MSEAVNEVEQDGYDRGRQRINLGIHPLGGVLLDITDAYGNNAKMQLDQQMLSQMVLTLITMNVMMTQQQAAANAMAEQQMAKEMWTPGG